MRDSTNVDHDHATHLRGLELLPCDFPSPLRFESLTLESVSLPSISLPSASSHKSSGSISLRSFAGKEDFADITDSERKYFDEQHRSFSYYVIFRLRHDSEEILNYKIINKQPLCVDDEDEL